MDKVKVCKETPEKDNEFEAITAVVTFALSKWNSMKSEKHLKGLHDELNKLVKEHIHHFELGYQACRKEKSFVVPIYPQKVDEGNDYVSTVLKNADTYYQNRYYYNALTNYTRAIKSTRNNSLTIAECYAKRSAVLFAMGLYRECIRDTYRAASIGVPEYIYLDLLNRREVAEKRQADQPVFEEKLPKFKQHTSIPCASQVVKITYNDQWGTHIVAEKDIKAGDVIAVERPFATGCVNIEEVHCYHCLKIEFSTIPCPTCPVVQFCSEECRIKSWQMYHRLECNILTTLREIGKEYTIVWKIALSLYHYLDFDPEKKIYEVLKLKAFQPLKNVEPKRIEELEKIAARMYEIITIKTDFIANNYNCTIQANNLKGMLMKLLFVQEIYGFYHHMNITIPNNKFTVFELKWHGLYLFHSLFNHSCDPNVIVTQNGTTYISRAVEDIKKGQQLFISYQGQCFWLYERPERIRTVAIKRGFICHCDACKEDWPIKQVFSSEQEKNACRPLKIIENLLDTNALQQSATSQYYNKIMPMAERKWLKPSAEYVQYVRCFWKYFAFADCLLNAFSMIITKIPFQEPVKYDDTVLNKSSTTISDALEESVLNGSTHSNQQPEGNEGAEERKEENLNDSQNQSIQTTASKPATSEGAQGKKSRKKSAQEQTNEEAQGGVSGEAGVDLTENLNDSQNQSIQTTASKPATSEGSQGKKSRKKSAQEQTNEEAQGGVSGEAGVDLAESYV